MTRPAAAVRPGGAVTMGEHVGAGQHPAFGALLAARVRPGYGGCT